MYYRSKSCKIFILLLMLSAFLPAAPALAGYMVSGSMQLNQIPGNPWTQTSTISQSTFTSTDTLSSSWSDRDGSYMTSSATMSGGSPTVISYTATAVNNWTSSSDWSEATSPANELSGQLPSAMRFTYGFQIDGPTNIAVPVLVYYSGSVAVGLTNSTLDLVWGNGSLSIGGTTVGSLAYDSRSGNPPSGSLLGNNIVDSLSVSPGVWTSISMTLGNAGMIVQPGSSATITIVIDPTIEIDPTWLQNNPGFSIETNAASSPVPIPAAAWLLAPGLGMLAGLRRRFKR
jgi:hypothetical protein